MSVRRSRSSMRLGRMTNAALVALALLAGAPGGTAPGAASPLPAAGGAVDADSKARQYFTDRLVRAHDGRALRFYSDVLANRLVVVTLFYAGCSGVCPVNNQKLAEMQELLGPAMGRDVFFVSITVDPEHDTVDALQAYAARFKAGPGWLFLTGAADDIGTITRRLGHTSSDPEEHVTFFMLGDVRNAHWVKVPPYEPAEAVVERLRQFRGAREAAGQRSSVGGDERR